MVIRDFGIWTQIAGYGYLGVNFFFILSGFVIAMSLKNRSASQFLRARATRLFPALWASATITFLVTLVLAKTPTELTILSSGLSMTFGGDRWISWAASLTGVPAWFGISAIDASYWSLLIEAHFYLLVAAVLTSRISKLALLAFILWLVASALNFFYPTWRFDMVFVLAWAPYFAAGMLFYRWFEKGLSRSLVGPIILCFVLSLSYAHKSALRDGYEIVWLSMLIVGFFFAFFCVVASHRLEKILPSKLAQVLGAISYPLYLLHQVIGYLVFNWLHLNFTLVQSFPLITLALLLAVVTLVAYLVNQFVELPSRNIFRIFHPLSNR